ncbi:unnamed protein product [Adineta steineri]|uniref:Apple domain-containing protein n=1 Tax=Adineta steineri TaxID=433720 RepID=A0A815JGN7_9BILA|nr:unnamed protein product [Adineta steineri]CAF1379508.1 unnamed protein product [Adineta steineri]
MMTTVKNVRLFRVFIILSLLIIPNNDNHINGHIITEKLNVFANVEYQASTNLSIIGYILVRSSSQCAGQCIQRSLCGTASFNRMTHVCSLFGEPIHIGQLIQHNKMVIFGRTGINSSSTTTGSSSCSAIIPSFGNIWNCINVTTSITVNNIERLYLKHGVAFRSTVSNNITVFIESNANFSTNSAQDITVYIESGGKFQATSGENITAYVQSGATFTITGGGNIMAYLESGAKFSITSGGIITAYLKSNSSFSVASSGNITAYYESGSIRNFLYNAKTEILCSPIIFNYSNVSTGGC